jgi:hypothetical protein
MTDLATSGTRNGAPTVVLAIQQGFFARLMLQTEVLDTLLDSGVRVVVLTTDVPTVEEYLHNRGLSQIAVEQLPSDVYLAQARGRLKGLLRRLRSYGVRTKTVDLNFEMDWKDALSARSLPMLGVLATTWLVSRLMRASGFAMRSAVGLENRLDTPNAMGVFFRRYRPRAIVVSSPGFFGNDCYLIREANRAGVRAISYVQSWDNTTVRGLGVNLADQHIVWSEVMKDELVTLHKIPKETVAVDGVPHYDFYVNRLAGNNDKEWLAAEFGFDPQKRLLLLGTKSPNTFLYNADVAEAICEAILDGRLPEDCHLIARLHPIYFRSNAPIEWINEWKGLEQRYSGRCFSLDRPVMMDGKLDLFMADSEILKLASLLKYSDVVVNMFSTLNLEASIFDTPTVNVAFDFDHKRPPGQKIARFNIRYDEQQTHNQRVINSNGTTVAHSVGELFDLVNEYLDNQHLHAEGRRRIVANECGVNLGAAGKAVARTILSNVDARS